MFAINVLLGMVWGVQCSALWDRPCRALPNACVAESVRGLPLCAVPLASVQGSKVGVHVPCVRDIQATLSLKQCVYVLGDRAGTHPRGVASAVFPNLYSTWWKMSLEPRKLRHSRTVK